MTPHGDDIHNPAQPPAVLVAAIRKLLRPLVRLMLSFQITYPFLINLLKSLYVEVADQEFSVDEKRQTDSRITLLTGVHRKDVKRLRNEASESLNTPRAISIGAQLIAYWLGSEQFWDSEGKPLALPLRTASDSSGQKTFDDLVELVCKQDIRPRVILDEWLRLGIAGQDSDGRVCLNTGAFTPDKGFDEKVFFFGKNLHDHICASAHNLAGRTPSYFDRSVYYDKLSQASVQELAKLANDTGMDALTRMNKAALALQQRDQSKADRNYRMNFGVFNYNAELAPESEGNDHA
ncbi:MAG: hypothetical protein KDI28_02110 [Pseudomonadales bacterium]|nr:hypothetical protein [Pseudomonadales bacterium]MCP5357199.1 hypothetical protein [Pseudomonadales bacterium]